ncbi:uncharacterized protein LOC143288362 [Babylonia areolata]|uniref:uncharacterized protein LOC143288362 n=1 Tax=Babylonia areolata TaxID=304850 RepID=UPI003FD6919A
MSLKKLFSRSGSKKGATEFSYWKSMAETPPPGQVTDVHDPHKHIWKPQFSYGDQSHESRVAFYNSGFAACIRCGNRHVWRYEEKAGIRPNGETYGTEIFRCQTRGCKWKTSFKYDDGVPNCVHFEARGWPRGIQFFPMRFMTKWCVRHDLKPLKNQIVARRIDGDSFLAMHEAGTMQQELGLDSKTYKKIKKALEKPDTALITKNLCGK